MYVFLALLLLGILILLHEGGHFFAARLCRIDVCEFSVGIGPKLFSKQGKDGTVFSLRLFPIGGYCQFYGEDRDDPDPRAFNNQSVWKRIVTVLAGPGMNFIAAWLVIVIYLSAVGIEAVVPKVAKLEENAILAGMQIGDEIVEIDGIPVTDTDVITNRLAEAQGQPLKLLLKRGQENVPITVSPFWDQEAQRWRIGFSYDIKRVRQSLGTSIPFSVRYNWGSASLISGVLKKLLFKGEGIDSVTGVVGTVYVIQDVTRSGGIDIYLDLMALISVNLGIMNLLPFPGLDGSRLLFLIIEAIRRKPVRREVEGAIHLTGMAILMGLMVILTYKDILTIMTQH